jgi:hypothetical protein
MHDQYVRFGKMYKWLGMFPASGGSVASSARMTRWLARLPHLSSNVPDLTEPYYLQPQS